MLKFCLVLLALLSSGEDPVTVSVESGGKQRREPRKPIDFSVTFQNQTPQKVKLFWDPQNGGEAVFQAILHPHSEQAISTYQGHKFFITPFDDLLETKMTYFDNTITLYDEKTRKKIDEKKDLERRTFLKEYYEKNGYAWKNYYPRDEFVIHHMYKPQFIGQTFDVYTNVSYHIDCPNDNINTQLQYNKIDGKFRRRKTEYCQLKSDKAIKLQIETLCTEPKIFRVLNVLSDYESQHIISLGNDLGLSRSTVTESKLIDTGRTSSTAWISRGESTVIDSIFRRIADIVNISESLLWLHKSAESLQLVHYSVSQRYNPHFDYQTDQENNRYITFLMYLNDVISGGKTGFPKASQICKDHWNFTDSETFAFNPGRNNAIFFYDLLIDGNVDDKTMHSGMPVEEGEKYMTNLWIWDHKFTKVHN